MAKIKYSYDDTGKANFYTLVSDEKSTVPSCGFHKEEEAELALAIANVLKAHGLPTHDLSTFIKFVFRILRLPSVWVE